MGIISSLLRKTFSPHPSDGRVRVPNQMDIISSPLRETVGPTEQNADVENQIELSALDYSTTTEGETNICKIFKVPEQSDNNFYSFKPKTVSIGPYNHVSSQRDIECVKYSCRDKILRSSCLDRDEIKELQNKARSFYRDDITMEPKSFSEMLLYDGCFILAALAKSKRRAVENMDHLDQEVLNGHNIVHDLLLVGNQIPFCVLEEIHKIAAGEGETTESLKEEIAARVEGVLQLYPKAIRSSEICRNDFHHLLHLCHMFFRPSPNSVEHHHDQAVTNQWHRAKQYHEAGVEFRVKPSSTRCSLLDVTFSNGTMEIPHLSIREDTEPIFSNLILFEQENTHAGTYINAYITFMSKLLGTADDVELLVQKGIIDTLTGDNEQVSATFGRLNTLAVFDCGKDYYLKSVLQSVEAHYRWRPNWWMTWLMRNRLKNPFLALATLGGIIVVICTVIQTLFAILQFFMRPN